MNEDYKSILTLERMAFEEIQYKRSDIANPPVPNYDMNFERNIAENIDHVHFVVSLAINVNSKDGNISLRIKLTGFFSCDCIDDETKKILVNDNAIAILFPYLRSQVTLASTQPDIPPIIIPPVNIAALFKESEQVKS